MSSRCHLGRQPVGWHTHGESANPTLALDHGECQHRLRGSESGPDDQAATGRRRDQPTRRVAEVAVDEGHPATRLGHPAVSGQQAMRKPFVFERAVSVSGFHKICSLPSPLENEGF